MKNGIPWDVVMGLDDIERAAFCIIFGTMEGGEFSWEERRWRKRDA